MAAGGYLSLAILSSRAQWRSWRPCTSQSAAKTRRSLKRLSRIERKTRDAGYYIAGVYREKASGARVDRPELQRMIADLQPGDVVVVERMDRLSRLPPPQAEQLVNSIRAKGAGLAIPGLLSAAAPPLLAEADPPPVPADAPCGASAVNPFA